MWSAGGGRRVRDAWLFVESCGRHGGSVLDHCHSECGTYEWIRCLPEQMEELHDCTSPSCSSFPHRQRMLFSSTQKLQCARSLIMITRPQVHQPIRDQFSDRKMRGPLHRGYAVGAVSGRNHCALLFGRRSRRLRRRRRRRGRSVGVHDVLDVFRDPGGVVVCREHRHCPAVGSEGGGAHAGASGDGGDGGRDRVISEAVSC